MAKESEVTSTTQPKEQEELPSPFSDKKVRLVFIRKVYTILCAQLMLTVGIMGLFFIDSVKTWTKAEGEWIFYVAIAFQLVSLIALGCCPNVRRKTPQNYIFLTIFTATEGVTLGIATAAYDSKEVIMAVVVCTAITYALTAFALQTKIDFTPCKVNLLCLLMALVMFGIFCAVYSGEDQLLNNLYACFGALIFSVYIVYDTQIMMGGNHKYKLSPEEYVFAALNLYLDIINLFLFILEMMRSKKEEKSEVVVPAKVDEA